MRNRTKKVNTVTEINQIVRKYQSSAGIEYFIACEDTLGYLYGFTRLLLPTQGKDYKWLVKKSAIIRELHVYGQVEWLSPTKKSSNSVSQVQHTWFGKQLMEMAEKITQLHDFTKLSVISGVWVRAYYRKLWYKLEGTYMVKKI